MKEIAHSLGGKPKDVTVEKLYEYIDEMNDYEIIYALQWINGYIDHEQFHSLYNDVSMIVNDKLIVLVEHQSTINENMPLRFLLYVARLYETVVPKRDRYRRTVQSIPWKRSRKCL